MNRREALAALVSLPAAAKVSVAQIRSEDVIVLTCPGAVSDETAERIAKHANTVWPNNKILVLSDGMDIKIVEKPRG